MTTIRPYSFWQHIRHPFSFGSGLQKVSLSTKEKVAAFALLSFGLLFALIGGPIFFYLYTNGLKAKRIRALACPESPLIQKIQKSARQQIDLKPLETPVKPPQVLKPDPLPAPAPAPGPKPTAPVNALVLQPPPAPKPTLPNPILQPTPAPKPTPAVPPEPPAKPAIPPPQPGIDFAATKLLSQNQQGATLENLYRSSQQTLQRLTPIPFPQLAKTKKDVDTLEVTLNELAAHWHAIKEGSPNASSRDLARKTVEEESGLCAQLRIFIASAKRQIETLTTPHTINPAQLAYEVELMRKLPQELRDYRLEKILSTQFTVHRIKSDGNCGPRALAQGLGKGDDRTIRKEVTDYQLEHLEENRHFYEGDAKAGIQEMQKPGCYFTDRELIAFSEREKRPVGVLSIQSLQVQNNRLMPASYQMWGTHFASPPILLYNRPDHDNTDVQNQLDLNHYDLLVPKIPAIQRQLAAAAESA